MRTRVVRPLRSPLPVSGCNHFTLMPIWFVHDPPPCPNHSSPTHPHPITPLPTLSRKPPFIYSMSLFIRPIYHSICCRGEWGFTRRAGDITSCKTITTQKRLDSKGRGMLLANLQLWLYQWWGAYSIWRGTDNFHKACPQSPVAAHDLAFY